MNAPVDRPICPLVRLVIALWLAVSWTTQADDLERLSAKVIRVVGSARYCTNRFHWNVLGEGTECTEGTMLQTEVKDSSVDISLLVPGAAGQTTLRVLSNSVLSLIKLDFKNHGQSREIRLDLVKGQLRVSLDGTSEYGFEIIGVKKPMHLAIPQNAARQETVFVMAPGR